MQILIVDADPHSQKKLKETLVSGGYLRTHGVNSIKEAVEIREAFDLILVDIEVPDWEDISACRHLRLTAQFQDCPIIVVTQKLIPF
jgi:CheY-like chemotaxis protein